MSFTVGGIFGAGLCLSGMLRRSKISGFLTLDNNWDPSLLFVLASAVGFNLISFNIIKKRPTSILGDKMSLPGG